MASGGIREKPAYFVTHNTYNGPQPAYYERSDFPQADLLENNWQLIKEEMLGATGPQVASPIYNPNQATGEDKWKMVIFYNYLWKKDSSCKKYPKTHALLKQINGLTYAALNLLEPHSDIKAHHGDTNTTIRCHLGIDIPAPLPDCGLEVKGEQRSWQNGKILLFSDAHLHRAWNHSDNKRYVFVVDIIRPEYYSSRYWICAGVLCALSTKAIGEKFGLIGKIPFAFYSPVYFLIRVGWWLRILMQ